MDQFAALLWLKWTLFRNSMRSRKAVLGRVASILGTMAALAIALLVAFVLGITIYKILSPGGAARFLSEFPPDNPQASEARNILQSGFLLVFITLSLVYLMWATVPLSLGGASQFTPKRLLLYPVSLPKLFALDFLSEFTNLASIFAIPIILSIALGAGFGIGNVALSLPVAVLAITCGISITKWLSTSLSTLMQRRRSRGETLIALIGIVVALGGAFFGEFASYMARHAGQLKGLRWTPPGAVAIGLTEGLSGQGIGFVYVVSLLTLAGYTIAFVGVTYLIARHSALEIGGAKRVSTQTRTSSGVREVGWQLPLVSQELSAVIEKELRYAMRNAQLRMMALMPLVLIVVRLARGNRLGARSIEMAPPTHTFAAYSEGLLVAAGILYVFLILSSLSCNLFAYESGGMRALILAPIQRTTILIGKNLSIGFLALLLCTVLLGVNQLVFRDLSLPALGFAAFSFVIFAATFALIGNWLSIRFPKRLQFGKRMNASGVTGFLLIPILLVMAAMPILAAVAGYYTRSLVIKYVTLASFAVIAIGLYLSLIAGQGRALARHEQEILEAVSGRNDD